MREVTLYLSGSTTGSDKSLDILGPLSGSDRITIALAKALCSSGLDVTLVSPSSINRSHDYCSERAGNLRFKRVENINEAALFHRNNSAGVFIFPIKNDIEQINGLLEGGVRNIRAIAWAHNTPGKGWLAKAKNNGWNGQIVCVSNSQRAYLSHHGVDERTYVIPNFIPVAVQEVFDRIMRNDKVLPGLGRNKMRLSYIGALVPEKGVHNIFEIWPSLRAHHKDIELDVYGGMSSDQGFVDMSKSSASRRYFDELLGIVGLTCISELEGVGINLHGPVGVAQMAVGILRSHATIVNPNIAGSFETFCLSAIESQYLRRPVLGAARGALPETIGNMVGGILHDSQEAFSANVSTLLKNADLASRLGESGRGRVLSRYLEAAATGRWLNLLQGRSAQSEAYFDKAAYPSMYTARRALGALESIRIKAIQKIKR